MASSRAAQSGTSGPPFVGREHEVGVVSRIVATALGGQGRALLVGGPPGIGKTRLVRELTALGESQIDRVVWGHCAEADRLVPFALPLTLVNAFRAVGVDFRAGRPPGQAGWDRLQYVESLAGQLPAASAHRSLLLVVEDVQWADEGSLEFLLRLARQASGLPVLLVLTYRSEELGDEVISWLDSMRREQLAEELVLGPLAPEAAAVWLRAVLGESLRPDIVADVYELSGGNPFFMEEVARLLQAEGEALLAPTSAEHRLIVRLPRTVQQVLRRRLHALSPETRAALEDAAVIGIHFRLGLLAELSQRTTEALLPALREAVASHLVTEVEPGTFAFEHELTRLAVASDLLARERQERHARLADILETADGAADDARDAAIVYHAYEAQQWERVGRYAARVGERALQLSSSRAAIRQLSRAIQADAHLGREPQSRAYLLRARAYETAGDFERAKRDLETAIALAQRSGEPVAEGEGLIALGMLWAGRDYERTGPLYERALELARTVGDPPLIARALNHLGNWHANRDEAPEAWRLHEEALTLAERQGDTRGIAETLDLLGMAYVMGGKLPSGLEASERALAMFEQLDDRRAMSSTLASLSIRHGSHELRAMPVRDSDGGPPVEAERALALARDLEWRSGQAYALISLASTLGARGEFGRALRLARRAATTAREIGHEQWVTGALVTLGALHLELLQPELAHAPLDEALALAERLSSVSWYRLALAFAAEERTLGGEPADAVALLEEELSRAAKVDTASARALRLAYGEAVFAAGDSSAALGVARGLISASESVMPRVWRLEGDALRAAGEAAEAIGVLEPALRAALARDWLPEAHRLRLSLARARAPISAASARAELDEAARLATRLAASLDEDDVREEFLRRVSKLVPHTSRGAARPAGLTRREQEVLGLVADGLTNSEIAERLVIGKRTVESHIGRILSKTDSASRAQAVRWAIDHGIGRVAL